MNYAIENERYSVSVSTVGAELQSFYDKKSQIEYIWQGDPKIWGKRAPLLFPIVGKLKDDMFSVNGRSYRLQKHGFAMHSEFQVSKHTENEITFALHDTNLTREQFPFAFELCVSYALTGNQLEVTHSVKNLNSEEMYFSIGAHPGFRCQIGDYLEFEVPETLATFRLDQSMLRADDQIPVLDKEKFLTITEHIFVHDALLFQDMRSNKITLKSPSHAHNVTVEFGDAPCLGIWAKPNAPYVCIEPWYGIDDSHHATGILSEKEQIITLGAGDLFRFPIRIIVS